MTESKYANFDYDLSIKILTLLKGGYPARLKRVLVVTAPLWFKAPFKILRLFVKEKLRDREIIITVYTVSVSELITYIPKNTLPLKLGGTQPPVHPAWLQLCHLCAVKQSPDPSSYFQSRLSPPQTTVSPSPSSEFDNGVSDPDSESSKDTINEKHTNEDREKEKEDGDDSDMDDKINKQHGSKDHDEHKIGANRKRKTSECRKSEDVLVVKESKNDTVSEEPRKKRPPSSSGSNILDDSIHMPDTTGMTVMELLEKVNSKKRKGLVGEYGSIKMEAPAGTFNNSKLKPNVPKNRYTDVLCLDHSRVILDTDTDESDMDYINANHVDGYMQKNGFISTQGPLPKTFTDFWRMVWQNQTRVIVMTTKTMERSRTKCGQYWPLEEESNEQFDDFIVYNEEVLHHDDFVETKLVMHNTNGTGESRKITHLQFTSWPDYGVPPAEPFLDFLFRVREVQSNHTRDMGSEWEGHPLGPPIIVHCSAGIGRTGTFITVDICLRRLEHIGTVDVRETVRGIRSQRAFSIQVPDQYIFCHTAVIEQAMKQGLIDSLQRVTLEDSDSE